MKRPIMTLTECLAEMREHGIPCSPSRVANEIENGTYPFGRVKSYGKTQRRTFEIWRVDFEKWLREKGCDVK